MAWRHRQLHQQLVLDQGLQVKVAADDEYIIFQFVIQHFGRGLILYKTETARYFQALAHRLQAALALHRQLCLGLQFEPDFRTAAEHRHHAALRLPAYRCHLIAVLHHIGQPQVMRQYRLIGKARASLGKCRDVQMPR